MNKDYLRESFVCVKSTLSSSSNENEWDFAQKRERYCQKSEKVREYVRVREKEKKSTCERAYMCKKVCLCVLERK